LRRKTPGPRRHAQPTHSSSLYQRDHALEAQRAHRYVMPIRIIWKINTHKTIGVAHETEADDVYMGYLIPKGTRILPLDW